MVHPFVTVLQTTLINVMALCSKLYSHGILDYK